MTIALMMACKLSENTLPVSMLFSLGSGAAPRMVETGIEFLCLRSVVSAMEC